MMKENKVKSEQLSFYQLFTGKGYSIEVPIIQRDYAQGRKSASDLRVSFLNKLYDYLEEGTPFKDLDFVYGDVDANGNLIPLDGQQRLTTLFLLHWYLSIKDDHYPEFKNDLLINDFSKFRYKTRQSATDFCNAFLINGIDLNKLLTPDPDQSNALSKTIRDRNWYHLSWDNDPTIQSMLCMLDAINDRFCGSSGFYSKLTNNEYPVITFRFLPLKHHGLTDDLYIKMNSRGILLTRFETFKAKFEKALDNDVFNSVKYDLYYGPEQKKKEVDTKSYFSHKIDTHWADLFWKFKITKERRDHESGEILYEFEIDTLLMNFISTLAINHVALHKNEVKGLIDNQTSLPFSLFADLDENFGFTLIKTLDLISGDHDYHQFLVNFSYYDEINAFKKIINKEFKDAAYLERIQFFAYYSFLAKWNGKTDGFTDWMRVISNLSENTVPYNNDTEFINAIGTIDKMLPFSNDIFKFLKSGVSITGFNPSQLKEERIKACLLGKDKKWSDSIYEYEIHKYFKGQLTFALAFSGIEQYYDDNKRNCDWNEADDEKYWTLFERYIKLVFSLFEDDGLKQKGKENHRLHRAVLSKGDYLLNAQSNRSFLIDKGRDISWKRLLQGDEGRKDKREFLKSVLDDKQFDPLHLESLELIAADYNPGIPAWRKKFILYPELFNDDYLGWARYIRKNSDTSIYLLKGVKTSGEHSELFTLAMYINLQKDNFNPKPFDSLTYYPVSGESDEPCFYLNFWTYKQNIFELDVYYINGQFEVSFVDKQQNEIPVEIQKIVDENNLTEANKHFSAKVEEDGLKIFLMTLCKSFNALQ